jgi:hypothetical protein
VAKRSAVSPAYTRTRTGQINGQSRLPLANGTLGEARPTARPGALGLTFRNSREQPVHRWYPYVEGFSASYVHDWVSRLPRKPEAIFDPFGGTGTTQLTASGLGIESFYAEVNPFIAFVAETKVVAAAWARNHFERFSRVALRYRDALTTEELDELGTGLDLGRYHDAFPDRGFFEEQDLRRLLAARHLAERLTVRARETRPLLLLACAANAVAASNMTRRADLRRRRADEYKTRVVDVASLVRATVDQIIADIPTLPEEMAPTTLISADARALPASFSRRVEFAITSPPYLNGTNYFRNTKLELWLLDFIAGEVDLADLHKRALAAGINSVHRQRVDWHRFDSVEMVASELDASARDRRIPLLVRHYFSDMFEVIRGVNRALKRNGTFVMDIGDSKFYGVHVATDRLLTEVAAEAGLELVDHRILARRYSYDRSDLVQAELIFRKR